MLVDTVRMERMMSKFAQWKSIAVLHMCPIMARQIYP
jgi:hypothetical protein